MILAELVLTLALAPQEAGSVAAPPQVRVTESGHGRLYTVRATNHSVHDILNEVAKASGRSSITVEERGIASDLAGVLLRVDLRDRTLNEIVEYVAGAAGLEVAIEPQRFLVREIPRREGADGVRELTERAIRTYRNVLVRHVGHPDSARIYLEMGNLRYRTEAWFEAIQEYDSLIRLFPDHAGVPEALLHSAQAFEKLGDKESARRRLQTLARQYEGHPLVVEAYLSLARLYRDQKDNTAERDAIRSALASLADHVHPPEVHVRASAYLIEGGEYGLADQLLQDLLRRRLSAEDREHALYQRVRALFEMGSDLEAVTACTAYLAAFPKGEHAGRVYLLLARTHLRSKTPLPGLLAVEHVAQALPQVAAPDELDLLRALLYEAMSLESRALAILEPIVASESSPVRRDAAEALARIASGRAAWEKAKYAYVQYRRSGGPADRAMLGIAECWLAQGNPARARDAAQAGLELSEHPDTARQLKEVIGKASTLLGDHGRAAAIFGSSGKEEP
ncbi:MAG: tetratricopeptide repeat protein [Planctomycetota bacterium]